MWTKRGASAHCSAMGGDTTGFMEAIEALTGAPREPREKRERICVDAPAPPELTPAQVPAMAEAEAREILDRMW